MRGPPFLLRGIPGRDSRSPSLSLASPLIVWGESSLGGPSAWVGASKSRSGWQRTEPGAPNQSRERGAGQPGTPASRALEARLLAAASAEERSPGVELSTAARPLRALSAPRPSWGGAGHPLRSTGPQPRGDMAFQPWQLSPTSCGRCGSAVLGRFYTASSTSGTRWVSGVVLDSYLPLCFCLLCVLVSTCPCLSQFLSLILDLAYRIRSGFVSRSLSSCFSWDVPASPLLYLFSFLSVLPYYYYYFPPLAASLLSSLLPGHLEHHQLPYSETPCPGENTPALLGTSRYRDLLSQSRRRLGNGSRVLLSGPS